MISRPDVENRDDLLDLLERRGCTVRGSNASCPSPDHDDRTPSASIYEKGGHWRVHCHCCARGWDAVDLAAEDAGTEPADLLRDTREKEESKKRNKNKSENKTRLAKPPKTWATWKAAKDDFPLAECFHTYSDPQTGAVELLVIRRPYGPDRQKVGQVSWDGDLKAYVSKGLQGIQPLYNRRRMIDSQTIVVVEGEKDVESLAKLGIVATTSPMGAGKAGKASWTPLAGKDVILWPDRDEPGLAHMDDVCDILQRMARPPKSIARIDPDEQELPKDVTDLIEQDGPDSVQHVLSRAKRISAIAELYERISDLTTGKRSLLAWPVFPHLSKFAPMTTGSVIVVVGPEGCGKSLFLMQVMVDLLIEGKDVSALLLEKDMPFYLLRVLAQLECNNCYATETWLAENGDVASVASAKHEEILSRFKNATQTPRDEIGTRQILDWLELQASNGRRMLIVDPISAKAEGDNMAEDHKNMVKGAEQIAGKYGCTVFFTTHPRTGSIGKPGLDALYGGKGVTRFADYVIWLNTYKDNHGGPVKTSEFGIVEKDYNRTAQLLKTRSSMGEGMSIAFALDRDRLRFSELGLAMPKKRRVDE